MKAKSCFSENTNPYRAGIELGMQLAEIDPEVIFLFPSIHYEGSPELPEAIYDALESDKAVLIGNTGDGFYERERVGNTGVAALGINTSNKVRWHISQAKGVGGSPHQAVNHCLQKLKESINNGPPQFYFMSCDFRVDTSELVQAIQSATSVPLIGGSAADAFEFKRSFVYTNRKVSEDSMAMLAAEGELEFEILISQDLVPVGTRGTITACQGTTIFSIDDHPANHFIFNQTGQSLNAVDEGILTIQLTDSDGEERRLRSLLLEHDGRSSEDLCLFGGVNQGDEVQLCRASAEKILRNVGEMGEEAASLPFNPVAGVMVSCAGRKRVLGKKVNMEVHELVSHCPSLSALVGFPSYGEVGPVRNKDGYSRTLFHNMTCILLLLGDAMA